MKQLVSISFQGGRVQPCAFQPQVLIATSSDGHSLSLYRTLTNELCFIHSFMPAFQKKPFKITK